MNLWRIIEVIWRLLSTPGLAWRTAITEARIRESLHCEDAILAMLAEGKPYQSQGLADSTEFICPEFTIHTQGFNQWVQSASAELTIVLVRGWQRISLLKAPIILSPTPWEFGGVAIKWSGTSMSTARGSGSLRVLVAAKEIVRFPLHLYTWNDLALALRVTELRINVTLSGGQVQPIPARVGQDRLVSISPSFVVESPCIAPASRFPGRILVAQGDQLIAEAPLVVCTTAARVAFQVKPVRITSALRANIPMRIVVEIATVAKASHSIAVLERQAVTNEEGSLIVDVEAIPVSAHDLRTATQGIEEVR